MRLQFFAQPGGGINRYIMECKYVVFGSPLWYWGLELIDTLWNVNYDLTAIAGLSSWINRYIMECKLKTPENLDRASTELIDTLWNVNLKPHELPPKPGIRINRYIMECKSIREIKDVNTLWELIDTLWNVNLEQLIRAKQNLRINRYIMECKWMKKEKYD